MNLIQWLREITARWFSPKKVAYDPQSDKLRLINDQDELIKDRLDEFDAWYSGNDNELNDYYKRGSWYNFAKNPIYNNNKRQSFWALSSIDEGFYRTTCGFARDLVSIMCDKVNAPRFSSSSPDDFEKISAVCAANSMNSFFTQIALPWSLVEGTGCVKFNFSKSISPSVKLEFFKERDIKMITSGGTFLGCAFKSYYKGEKDEDYTLLEIRHISRTKDGSKTLSIIEYKLIKNDGEKDGVEVPLDTLEATKNLKTLVFDYDKPLCTPFVIYPDGNRFGYGISVYVNKVSIFNNLDEAYTMQEITTRHSGPIDYYDPTQLEKDSNGMPIKPSCFNRQFMPIGGGALTDGDGKMVAQKAIITSQPELNIEQYAQEIDILKTEACGKFVSPSTMGVGMSRKDNAESQREKEKTTITSRNYIISCCTPLLIDMMDKAVRIQDFMDTGVFDKSKVYDIGVKFDEFASPTFESKAKVLLPLLGQGGISPLAYVDMLWGDSKSAAEKEAEIEYVKAFLNRKSENPIPDQPESKSETTTMASNAKEIDSRPDRQAKNGTEPDLSSYGNRDKPPLDPENMPKVD